MAALRPSLDDRVRMTSPTDKLGELGITLPPLPAPAGNYVHAVRTGRWLFLAGKGAGPYTGKVGGEVSVQQAYEYARHTTTMLLAVVQQQLGSLDHVARIVKVVGFVNAVAEFSDHPQVLNGCSDLLVEIFGERGRHARSAVGVSSTPGQIPVEIEMVVECNESQG
jgi:enamine deaminase RidA (YjgF/YER057c/UK114 family)